MGACRPLLLEPQCSTCFQHIRCSCMTQRAHEGQKETFLLFHVYILCRGLSRYVPPDQARAVSSVQASVSGSSASSTGSTPEVQPLKTLQLNKTPLRQVAPPNPAWAEISRYLPSIVEQNASVCFLCFLATSQSPGLPRSQAHNAAQEKKFDLLSDLGGDIFAAPPTQASTSANFANFAHFPSQSGKKALSQHHARPVQQTPTSSGLH